MGILKFSVVLAVLAVVSPTSAWPSSWDVFSWDNCTQIVFINAVFSVFSFILVMAIICCCECSRRKKHPINKRTGTSQSGQEMINLLPEVSTDAEGNSLAQNCSERHSVEVSSGSSPKNARTLKFSLSHEKLKRFLIIRRQTRCRLFKYGVHFDPEIENERTRKSMLGAFYSELGVYTFDGKNCLTLRRFPSNPMNFCPGRKFGILARAIISVSLYLKEELPPGTPSHKDFFSKQIQIHFSEFDLEEILNAVYC